MGGGLSRLEISDDEYGSSNTSTGLGELPESCIAFVLSNLEAPQICKLARLNKTFYEASLSDSVWQPKLPDNHLHLITKLRRLTDYDDEYSGNIHLSKKQIYATLTHPIRFPGDTKEVWLDKKKGGICVAMSWKGMKITGIHDRRYWTHISTHESRFGTVAYLEQIWWLEIQGNIEFEFPVGRYSVFFRFQLGRPSNKAKRRSIGKIHGWNIKPVQFQLTNLSNAGHSESECFLEEHEHGIWIEHHVGDFVVGNSSVPTRINFSMRQIDCTHTKGGLCFDSVFILPSI